MEMVYSKLTARPLPERLLKLNGISARTIKEHYKLYEGYVNKANETRAKLWRWISQRVTLVQ